MPRCQEARERVRGAIRNSRVHHPPRRITVNLAPADLPQAWRVAGPRRSRSAILLGSEQVRAAGRWALVGELSLGGEVRPVPGHAADGRRARRGAASAGSSCRPRRSRRRAWSPASRRSVPRTSGRRCASCRSTRRVARLPADRRAAVRGGAGPAGRPSGPGSPGSDADPDIPDLADVRGQLEARRALEIALAGGHGLLLIGPPGRGKTLLARTIPGLLPPLDDAEALAATIVESVAAERPDDRARAAGRRSGAPHHTISYAGMVGGGPRLLAGRGDPRRSGRRCSATSSPSSGGTCWRRCASRSRTAGSRSCGSAGRRCSPRGSQLVAAMNPCPCGQLGAADRTCTCPPGVPERYLRRVSGPLRDRIDLWVSVRPGAAGGADRRAVEPEASAPVAARIAEARARQRARSGDVPNARVRPRSLRAMLPAGPGDHASRDRLADREGLSGRGTERLLRVARTIADLGGSPRRDRGPSRRGGALSGAGRPHGAPGGRLMLGVGREGAWRRSDAPIGGGEAVERVVMPES